MLKKNLSRLFLTLIVLSFIFWPAYAEDKLSKEEKNKQELQDLQKEFEWWPTDARPGPVKDDERAGYWWWPQEPGTARPWGNRGYVYVYKIIFDYKAEELPAPKPQELRPSLLIKKIVKNVKIYFDYDKAHLRDDALKILASAIGTLKRSPETSILITGNCDIRGSEKYNEKLGRERADAVKKYMLDNGIPEERIRIISRGKLDAIGSITDIVGMQKDRNAQFMIAEVEEVMIPYSGQGEVQAAVPEATKIEEGKFLVEEEKKVESEVKVSTREYTVRPGDTLSKIAQEQLGGSHRWKYLYEVNKDRIKDPNKLKAGKKIIIPVE
ncbi:MAG: OmpA family protein [Candidatus Omnitrophota bacterium]